MKGAITLTMLWAVVVASLRHAPCLSHRGKTTLSCTPDMNWDTKSAPKLDFEEDLYSVLEVEDSIEAKDLKKAYYKLVFKYHPDNKEGEAAKALSNKQMMVINNAYKVLKEGSTRAAYDRKRKFGAFGGKASSSSSSSSSSSTNNRSRDSYYTSSEDFGFDFGKYGSYGSTKVAEDDEDAAEESLGDIFGEIFNDVVNNKGSGIMSDFLEWAEGNAGGKYDPFGEGGSASQGQEAASTKETLDGEIEVLKTAIKNLEGRYAEVKKERVRNERDLLNSKPRAGQPRDVDKLEQRLIQIEETRGLAARQGEMEKQLRTLKRKRNQLQEKRNYY